MGDKIRLLLVEDEQTLAGIIADTLSEKGFEVTVAHDGEAGLRAFRGSRPDVVVSDVMMPCMDGFTFVGACAAKRPGCLCFSFRRARRPRTWCRDSRPGATITCASPLP